MKNLKNSLSSLLLTAALVTTSIFPAFAADSSVTYEGGAEKFVFLPGSEYTDTDLFDNFKNVMPGDSLEQKIVVKNDYKGCDYVKIYMRAEAHDEETNPLSANVAVDKETVASMLDFLSQLSMKVYLGDKVIYDASPDELDGLKENVLIGALSYGVSTELTVTLDVPAELGNEYAYREGEVDWVFTVEHRNHSGGGNGGGGGKTPTSDPEDIVIITPEDVPLAPGIPELPTDVIEQPMGNAPKTGDETVIWPYLLLLGAGVLGLILPMFKKRRKEQ